MARRGSPARRGLTQKQLAELAGVSVSTIANKYSEPRSAYVGRAQERAEKAVKLRLEGLTMREIAEELGVSLGSVHRYIKQAREEGKIT